MAEEMWTNCNKCGACCLVAPYAPDVNGRCTHLVGPDAGVYTCDIFDTRPDSCKIVVGDRTNDEMEDNCNRFRALVADPVFMENHLKLLNKT